MDAPVRVADQTRRRFVKNMIFGSAALLAFAAGVYVVPSGAVHSETSKQSPSSANDSATGSEAIGVQIQPSNQAEISIRVVYFGMPTSITGTKQETVRLSSPAYLSDFKTAITVLHPALKAMLPSMLILVDGISAIGNPPLQDRCEIDVLAAAAGG